MDEKEEVAGGWTKLHTEELHNPHSEKDIIRMTKTKRMRRARHAARTGEMRNACNILV
jgi:hypothetical protein